MINKNAVVNLEKDTVNQPDCADRKSDPAIIRILFSFCKEGCAVFFGHLDLAGIFQAAFARAGLPVLYTQGFNPLAKIEFAAPLSVGVSAGGEIAAADFSSLEVLPHGEAFAEALNRALPAGIRVTQAESFLIPAGKKKYALSPLLWGFGYDDGAGGIDYVPAAAGKQYRQSRRDAGLSLLQLRRVSTLAKNPSSGAEDQRLSYFDVYRCLYPAS